MTTKNQILLNKKDLLIVPSPKDQNAIPVEQAVVATGLKNLETLGFAFSQEVVEALSKLTRSEFLAIYQETVTVLREKVGAHTDYEPMYKGFPEEVMDKEEGELYFNAILHYLFGVMPATEEMVERFPYVIPVDHKPTIVKLATDADFDALVANLIAANTSISDSDKAIIRFAIENAPDVAALLPETIPYKENLSFVLGLVIAQENPQVQAVAKYFKTATDVLRLAVSLSDGDVSLAQKPRFRKFKNVERRLLLELLDNVKNPTEDMLRHKRAWINLGNILHPGAYKNRYANAYHSFDILRNDLPFTKYMGRVNQALERDDLRLALKLLENRPGDFARMLDQLLRSFYESPQILESFKTVVHEVSTPVLLQLRTHMLTRVGESKGFRTFMPKGRTTLVHNIDENRPALTQITVDTLVSIVDDALTARFANLETLGKVYMETGLEKMNVPFSQRSASEAMRTLVRGSRLKAPDTNVVRMFVHWKNQDTSKSTDYYGGRVDIDLSTAFYDAKYNKMSHVSYTRLKEGYARHSGDITDAPNGAAEYIDVDIEKALAEGIRYMTMNVYSFTGQRFADIPELFAGWMGRDGFSGEVFEPLSVQQKFNVTAENTTIVPMVFDLESREFIWVDSVMLNEYHSHRSAVNVENTLTQMGSTLRALAELDKPTLHDLFTLHAAGRGEVVETVEEADTVFSIEPLTDEELTVLIPQEPIEVDGELVEQPPLEVKKRNVTVFDTDVIMAEFLQ